MSRLRHDEILDSTDARLLGALADDPRAPVITLAAALGLSRNTVQARLARLEQRHALTSFEHRVEPAALGYPLTAFMTVTVTQRLLDRVSQALADIPEVVEVFGLSGATDLLVRVVARDADDLYRIAGNVLATRGVERTETALAMRRLVAYRVTGLLQRLVDGPS
jgi:DNA-binding Lrp family transcriptional regulator